MVGIDGQGVEASALPRLYKVSDLFDGKVDKIAITADRNECEAIAKAFDLSGLARFSANLSVKPQGRTLHVTGQVRAGMTRECVVSLELFDCDIRGDIDVRFSDDPSALAASVTDIPGNEADWIDPPDPIPGEQLDMGVIALEHLALAMDPYPRKPGVAFESDLEPDADSEKASPFAALQTLNLGEKSRK